MFEPHKFIPHANPDGPNKSCVKCGRAKDHPIHSITKEADARTK